MALTTFSKFYYGHTVLNEESIICFKEGVGPELIAKLPVGSYTLTQYKNILQKALNSVGSLEYTVSINRSTRILTIAASGTWSLLGLTGTRVNESGLPLAGINSQDYLNVTSVTGQNPTGYEYTPQFIMQDWVPPENNISLYGSTKSKSASGNKVSVQSFGEERLIKASIKYITDIAQDESGPIRSNANGLNDLIQFMDYAITQAPIELIPDENNVNSFYKCILDKTPESSDGTAWEAKEMYDKGLPFYYDTGKLEFKIIEE